MTQSKFDVVAFTDGGCRGNPGPGGWAFVVIHTRSLETLERAGGEALTTNNRMEILAAVEALRALRRRSRVLLVSDSKYLINAATEWMKGWKARGWTKKGGGLKNVDLLQELDAQLERHTVEWQWVAGHSGDHGNDRVDELANVVMDRLSVGDEPSHERRAKWAHPLPPKARA